jgi:tetratricopeptide (TPR) repeat protein/O-antigen ligase
VAARRTETTGTNVGATKILDKIISTCLALIFFLSPLFFTGLTAQGLGFEKMMLFYFLVLVALAAWATKGIMGGGLTIKRTPLDWPIIGVLAALTLSTVLSVNPLDSLVGSFGNPAKSLVAAIAFALFYCLVVNNVNAQRLKAWFWALICSYGLVVIYSIFQVFGIFILPFAATKANNFNPLGSVSGLTAFITVCIPFLMIAFSRLEKIHSNLNKNDILVVKIFLGVISAIGLILLALLNGFTFWPAAVVGAVVILIFFLARVIEVESKDLIFPGMIFVFLIMLLVLGSYNFKNLNVPAEVSLSRGASWDIAKNTFKADPIFGSGPSTFYYDFSKYKGVDFNSSPLWNVRFDNASGVLFELLATTGVLGALGIILLLIVLLPFGFFGIIKSRDDETQPILLAAFAGLIAILILALLFSFNNALILFAFLIIALMIGGVVAGNTADFKEINFSFESSAERRLVPATVFLAVVAGIAILFTVGFKMFAADVYIKDSFSMKMEDGAAKVTSAINLWPYRDNYYYSLANYYMNLMNDAASKPDSDGKNVAVAQNYLVSAVDAAKKAIDIAPQKASNNELLALIYESAATYQGGALEWSEDYYKRVMALEPDNPTPYLRIGLINMARARVAVQAEKKDEVVKDINEAIKNYNLAIAKKGDLASAYYSKGVAYENLGNVDNAIEEFKKSITTDNTNLDWRFELARLLFNRGASAGGSNQANNIPINSTSTIPDLNAQKLPGGTISRNNDLNSAEQLFLSILNVKKDNANTLYSLALLYQKVGETDNVKKAVTQLLSVLQEDSQKEMVKKQFPGI